MANATSHHFTLMLYPSELLVLIIWEEQEDSTEKVLKHCFPNCRHCKKTKEKWSFMPSHIIVSVVAFKPLLVLTDNHKQFCSITGRYFGLNYYWSQGLLFMVNSTLPDHTKRPPGIHSLAVMCCFAKTFSFLSHSAFPNQIKQILGGYWHCPGRW